MGRADQLEQGEVGAGRGQALGAGPDSGGGANTEGAIIAIAKAGQGQP